MMIKMKIYRLTRRRIFRRYFFCKKKRVSVFLKIQHIVNTAKDTRAFRRWCLFFASKYKKSKRRYKNAKYYAAGFPAY